MKESRHRQGRKGLHAEASDRSKTTGEWAPDRSGYWVEEPGVRVISRDRHIMASSIQSTRRETCSKLKQRRLISPSSWRFARPRQSLELSSHSELAGFTGR